MEFISENIFFFAPIIGLTVFGICVALLVVFMIGFNAVLKFAFDTLPYAIAAGVKSAWAWGKGIKLPVKIELVVTHAQPPAVRGE